MRSQQLEVLVQLVIIVPKDQTVLPHALQAHSTMPHKQFTSQIVFPALRVIFVKDMGWPSLQVLVNKAIIALKDKIFLVHQNTSVPSDTTVLEILLSQLLVSQEVIQIKLANGNALFVHLDTIVTIPKWLRSYLQLTFVHMATTAPRAHDTLHSTLVPLEHSTITLGYTALHNVSHVLVDISVLVKD